LKQSSRAVTATVGVVAFSLVILGCQQLPALGANGLLHPAHHVSTRTPPEGCVEADFAGSGVMLKGWRCLAAGTSRGTIVYLHGIADNRGSSAGVIQRFRVRGFNVVAYDSRAHGESEGEACTYGFFEKEDLHRVIDVLGTGPIVLIGTSLGAAVALQEAADDSRISAIVAAETFSDLRTVATERAPAMFTSRAIARAFELSEAQGHFQIDAVSPAKAASRITAPVLLIHGAEDVETPAAHSNRVLAALAGPKRLIVVPRAGHNGSLNSDVWKQVEKWIDQVLIVHF
jgi:pimeloyl-ACP methyl ester carboxylesterase